MKKMTAGQALECLKSGDNVYIHSVAAAPQQLIKAMTARASGLKGINIYQLHTEGEAPYAQPEYAEIFHVNSLFIGPNVRKAINEGRGSYIPVFLSEMPQLFRKNIIPIDIALISVSPPDKHGYCTLGPSVDATRAAVESASIVIAQVNKEMPRTHGDGFLHIDKIDRVVEYDEAIPSVEAKILNDTEKAIGRHIAGLIENGSTLQMGIGAIPNAVLAALGNHKNLGVHTEMFSDGVIPLIEKGVINGKRKKIHNGQVVATFVMGTQKLYDFVDDNPEVVLLDCEYVNATSVIRQNPKMVAINSAVEIDLTGQVCADSIGSRMYSGVGGQMDFIRGASLSEGGKPIIALPSVTKRGESRIVPYLKRGAGVVTTRAHVQYVVTEYGIANLYGKSIEKRIGELIRIAHPKHREWLEKESVGLKAH